MILVTISPISTMEKNPHTNKKVMENHKKKQNKLKSKKPKSNDRCTVFQYVLWETTQALDWTIYFCTLSFICDDFQKGFFYIL